MANHSIFLAWKILWTEEPGGLPFRFIVLFCFFSTLKSMERESVGSAQPLNLSTSQQVSVR